MTPSPWIVDTEAINYLRLEHLKHAIEVLHRKYRRKEIKAVKDGKRWLTMKDWMDDYLKRNRS